jgi:hypothetical protein
MGGRSVFRLVGFMVVLGLLIPSVPKTTATLANAPQAVNSTSNMIINEVMFYPDVGGYDWVELKNNGTAPENIDGYALTDEDGLSKHL